MKATAACSPCPAIAPPPLLPPLPLCAQARRGPGGEFEVDADGARLLREHERDAGGRPAA